MLLSRTIRSLRMLLAVGSGTTLVPVAMVVVGLATIPIIPKMQAPKKELLRGLWASCEVAATRPGHDPMAFGPKDHTT